MEYMWVYFRLDYLGIRFWVGLYLGDFLESIFGNNFNKNLGEVGWVEGEVE